MKVIINVNKLTMEDLELIKCFVETQFTTDRERKTTSILLDDLNVKVTCDKWGDIEKINISRK